MIDTLTAAAVQALGKLNELKDCKVIEALSSPTTRFSPTNKTRFANVPRRLIVASSMRVVRQHWRSG